MSDEVRSMDPEALAVRDFDVRGCVFVIPIDAPVPSEMTGVTLPEGDLYQRLAPLAAEPVTEFAFVPISGQELSLLDRAWRSLQKAKRVYALAELPGARYDVLFTQAIRMIGIPRVEWPHVAEALASRTRLRQRTKDSAPWQGKDALVEGQATDDEQPKPARQVARSFKVGSSLPVPSDVGGDEDPV